MYSSGFEASGADTLRALCRRLFHLTGYEEYNKWIYGSE
jgi:hypothetical protein